MEDLFIKLPSGKYIEFLYLTEHGITELRAIPPGPLADYLGWGDATLEAILDVRYEDMRTEVLEIITHPLEFAETAERIQLKRGDLCTALEIGLTWDTVRAQLGSRKLERKYLHRIHEYLTDPTLVKVHRPNAA